MINLWILLLIITTISVGLVLIFSDNQDCSNGWYVTGYYTPFEEDFAGESTQIQIDGKEFKFDNEFLKTIKTEGWGKTKSNQYLGWYDSEFHLNNFPTDMHGNELIVSMIAADESVLDQGIQVLVPTLPEHWNDRMLIVSDIGPSIIGKHIDVYTGEGEIARVETERITGIDNTLCVEQ